MKELLKRRCVKPIVYALFISLLAGLLMNVIVVLSIELGRRISAAMVQVMSEFAIVLSIAVIPYFIYRRALSLELKHVSSCVVFVKMVEISVAVIVLMSRFEEQSVIHFLVIALAEEFHFRMLQYEYLLRENGLMNAIVLSSIIFAFVFHLNDMLIMNLLIRLPLGIMLGVIRSRVGFGEAIVIHMVYDVVVSTV